jgi:prepilin-type processing-associated H-X9-DG protein
LKGVSIVGGAAPQIRDMNILQNQQIGLEVIGNSSPSLFKNAVSNNGIGVLIADNANPSFGSSSEPGGNDITMNTFCDLRHLGSADVRTVGTRWDQDVFDFAISNICTNGANIVVEGSGAVDFQFIPPKDTLLFPGTRRILLDQPAFGELLFTQEPSFVWTNLGNHIMIVVVWTQPPIVGTGGIRSGLMNVYWLWHSGLGTGGAGNALFADGRSIGGTSITNTSAPRLFEKGRSYYWAAWEWSEDGTTVFASSPLSYFRVSN